MYSLSLVVINTDGLPRLINYNPEPHIQDDLTVPVQFNQIIGWLNGHLNWIGQVKPGHLRYVALDYKLMNQWYASPVINITYTWESREQPCIVCYGLLLAHETQKVITQKYTFHCAIFIQLRTYCISQ